jgi:hypothetical protein
MARFLLIIPCYSDPPAYDSRTENEYHSGSQMESTHLAPVSRQVRFARFLNTCGLVVLIYGAVLAFLSVMTLVSLWVS